MANPLIRKFDIGTQIVDTLIDQDGQIIDLSPATIRRMVFRKADGSVSTVTASNLTDGTDGKLVYTTIAGDLDQIGKWVQQSYIVLPTGQWFGPLNPFVVNPNLAGGPSPPPPPPPGAFNGTNNDSVSMVAGQVVAVGLVRASAADGTKPAVGLAIGAATVGSAVSVQTDSVFTLSDWTAITGDTLLLTGFDYFLSVTPGRLSLAQPTVAGQIVQYVGTAVSTTSLLVEIDTPILL